jgi:alkylated DNA nucleotide flippase Atl1
MTTVERILAIVESIPPGRVTTYGSIADVAAAIWHAEAPSSAVG